MTDAIEEVQKTCLENRKGRATDHMIQENVLQNGDIGTQCI